MDVAEALRQGAARLAAAGVDQPRKTAELLLAHALGGERVDVIAHPERAVGAERLSQFERDVNRRASREPLQYILGRQEFYGLELAVGPGALIPRPETEHLVEQALARLESGDRVCDVGTGSGAIAIAIASQRPDVRVAASDVSAEALAVARRNVERRGVRVELFQADLLAASGNGVFDRIVCNPPYVAEKTRDGLQHELTHEPEVALFGGEDGLDPYRRLIPQAERALRAGGSLLLEIGFSALPAVLELLRDGWWSTPEVCDDLAGIPRVVAAERQPSLS